MKPQQRPAPKQSSVFLLALQGMEVVYDASRHEILTSVKPSVPQTRDTVAAPRRDEQRP